MLAVRRLRVADAAAYRDIRLEALARHPEMFGSSLDRESAWTEADVAEKLEGDFRTFGGFEDGALLAVAGWHPKRLESDEVVAAVNAVYCRPAARGSGIIDKVIEAIRDDARGSAERMRAAVAIYNAGGRRFFEKLGFEPAAETWTAEKMGLRLHGDPDAVEIVDYFARI
ncbi:MAG: GNAT family N-acetyltransferase [Acetobacterales bacterium]